MPTINAVIACPYMIHAVRSSIVSYAHVKIVFLAYLIKSKMSASVCFGLSSESLI